MRLFRQVKEHPTVQETAGVVQAQAAGFVDKGKRTVTEKVSHRVGGRDVTDDLGTQPTAYPSSTSRAASAGGPT
jgi:hypothetical protein